MKNLRLESFGVQEMDAKELIKENGGFFDIVLGIVTLVGAGYAVGKEIGKTVYEMTH